MAGLLHQLHRIRARAPYAWRIPARTRQHQCALSPPGGAGLCIFRFENNDVDRRTVVGALGDAGLMAETEDLRAYYMTTKDRYDEVFPSVGIQYTAEGFGVSMGDRHSYNRARVPLMREGVPAKVVVDVVNESGEERTGRRGGYLNARFWDQKKPAAIRRDSSDDIDNDDDGDSHNPWGDQVVRPAPEIPIHPFCPVYHLNKHERFRVNVMDLKDYVFNKELGEQLVLPAITKNLVNVLIGQGRISFETSSRARARGLCAPGRAAGGGQDVDGGGLRRGHGAAPVLGAGGPVGHQPGQDRAEPNEGPGQGQPVERGGAPGRG